MELGKNLIGSCSTELRQSSRKEEAEEGILDTESEKVGQWRDLYEMCRPVQREGRCC
jgi:hypothetical protein